MNKLKKPEIAIELKNIKERLREIERTLFWYLETPTTKLLELQRKEFKAKLGARNAR